MTSSSFCQLCHSLCSGFSSPPTRRKEMREFDRSRPEELIAQGIGCSSTGTQTASGVHEHMLVIESGFGKEKVVQQSNNPNDALM